MCSSFRNLTALTACAALLTTLTAGDAFGYCLMKVTGAKTPYVKWTKVPAAYRISSNLKDAKIIAAIGKAFTTWGTVKCSKLKFTKAKAFTICADAACKAFNSPKTPYISVFWFTKKSGLFKNTANPKMPYMSYVYFSHDNIGGFAAVSIGVNGADYKWGTTGAAGVLDVQNEVTSLVGAAIGLNDSKVAGASMYPKIQFGDTSKQTLHQDDLNGLMYLYKDKGCPSPPPPGSNGCSSGGTKTDGKVTPPKDGGTTKADSGGTTKADSGGTTKADSGGTTKADSGGTTKADTGGSTADTGGTSKADGGTTYADGGGSSACTKQSDCASGWLCTIEGKCVKQGGGDGDDDGGCNCAVPGRPSPALPLALLLGLVMLAWRRRR